jgi:two-component system LytT family sensor kinase
VSRVQLAAPGIGRRRWLRAVGLPALGWVVFAAVYATLLYAQSLGAMGPWLSLRVALEDTLLPAALGCGVWWLTGRYRVPQSGLIAFLAVHLALAVVFAGVWTGWILLAIRGFGPSGMSRGAMVHTAIAWQTLIGFLLYGLIAGSSYAARGALDSRDMRLAAERADRLRTEAELAALRAHISPHFLFNTLHSVSELLRLEPAAAQGALERLSDLFRYSLRLDRHGVNLVRLEDEWKFTDSYLWLERLRLGDRLRVNVEIDDDALDCLVPPFTLQPIVENAIRHGLGPKPGGGTLVVRAHEDDGRLTIQVSDDGMGADRADIEGSAGLGLRSVRQRLTAQYGSAASVDVVAGAGAGVLVTMTLPVP